MCITRASVPFSQGTNGPKREIVPTVRVDGPSQSNHSALPPTRRTAQYHCMESTAAKATPTITVPAVELRGITKVFPGVVANDSIDMVVNPGEIHAVMGENGCGKSTLMNMLYGMYRPDAGTIVLNGREVSFASPVGSNLPNLPLTTGVVARNSSRKSLLPIGAAESV